MIYLATFDNLTFAAYSLELLAYAIVDTLDNPEQYLYFYGEEAKKQNIYFRKRLSNKLKYNLSRKEIGLIYRTIHKEIDPTFQ